MKDVSKIELIKQYQQKACCYHSKRKAKQIFNILKKYCSVRECIDLSRAVDHYFIGEGRAEFDDICKKILLKQKEG